MFASISETLADILIVIVETAAEAIIEAIEDSVDE